MSDNANYPGSRSESLRYSKLWVLRVSSGWVIAMAVLVYLGGALLCYCSWAAVLAEGYFHLVWSSALSALTILISLLRYQIFPVSITILLYLLTLFVSLFCIGLSPLQRVFYSAVEVAPPDQKRMQPLGPKSSRHDSDTVSPLAYACEFVYPALCVNAHALILLRSYY